MIVRNAPGRLLAFARVLQRNCLLIALVVGIEIVQVQIHERMPRLESSGMMRAAIGLLAGTLGVFLSFKFSGAYARWWEARKLWGGIVNESRTFARQVTTWLPDASKHREFVYRHLAYVNALRIGLRRQNALDELDPFLDEDEQRALRSDRNPATQLLQRQSKALAAALSGSDASGAEGAITQSRFDQTLTRLTDYQGGLERIKNTAFPNDVIRATGLWVWIISLLAALAFIDPAPEFRPLETFAVVVVALSFQRIAQLGTDLTDPFENLPNDTPMTALCRTIEIDLRQQLGETELPEPCQPVNGVLM